MPVTHVLGGVRMGLASESEKVGGASGCMQWVLWGKAEGFGNQAGVGRGCGAPSKTRAARDDVGDQMQWDETASRLNIVACWG